MLKTIVCMVLSALCVAAVFNWPKWKADAKANSEAAITRRGRALLIAIETGLVKANESGNYEVGAFLEFYDRFLRLDEEERLKERKEVRDNVRQI